MVESYLRVDENYSRVHHRNLFDLRQNKKLYWNLIYYFSKLGLPLQFLIPYVPKDLLLDQASSIEVLNHATLLDKVRYEGMAYLDCWIEAKQKKEKKKEAREMAQAKASGQQLKRVITVTKRSGLFLSPIDDEEEKSSNDNVLEFSTGLKIRAALATDAAEH